MTARVSMLLKSRASLTCFRACFLPRRAKDLSAPGIVGGTVNTTVLYYKNITSFYNLYIFRQATKYKDLTNDGS